MPTTLQNSTDFLNLLSNINDTEYAALSTLLEVTNKKLSEPTNYGLIFSLSDGNIQFHGTYPEARQAVRKATQHQAGAMSDRMRRSALSVMKALAKTPERKAEVARLTIGIVDGVAGKDGAVTTVINSKFYNYTRTR